MLEQQILHYNLQTTEGREWTGLSTSTRAEWRVMAVVEGSLRALLDECNLAL